VWSVSRSSLLVLGRLVGGGPDGERWVAFEPGVDHSAAETARSRPVRSPAGASTAKRST